MTAGGIIKRRYEDFLTNMLDLFKHTFEPCQVLSVLIIESDSNTRTTLAQIFSSWFVKVNIAGDIQEAMSLCNSCYYDLVVSDLSACHSSEFSQFIQSDDFQAELLVTMQAEELHTLLPEHGQVLLKPLEHQQIRKVVACFLAHRIEKRRNMILQQDVQKHILATTLIGNSGKTKYLRQLIRQYSSSKAPVLIEGELRAGKELTARAIHAASGRIGSFVAINCAEPETEAAAIKKIFGQSDDKGNGALWLANYGTLFLNSVECLSGKIQETLLLLFENRGFKIPGTGKEALVDVRIIVATSYNLHQLVMNSHFSADLYNRLSVLRIKVPPLRERSADLRDLFPYLTRKLCRELSVSVPEWVDAHDHFELWDYSWPGNVKELKNLIERCLLLNQSPTEYHEEMMRRSSAAKSNVVVSVSNTTYMPELPTFQDSNVRGYPSNWSLKEVEQAHIQQVVNFNDGNKSAAARQLGISRKTLDRKFKEWESDDH